MSLRSLSARSLLRCCGKAGGGEKEPCGCQLGSIGCEWGFFVAVNRYAIARSFLSAGASLDLPAGWRTGNSMGLILDAKSSPTHLFWSLTGG